jgi:hypothetical protein
MAVPGNPLPTYPPLQLPNQISSEPSGPILTFPEPPQAKIAPPALPMTLVEEKRPPVLPEVILGKAGPETVPVPVPATDPATSRKFKSPTVGEASETPLIQAILAYQNNNPEAALTFLKTYDPTTQQILISLMPSLVRISEGKLAEMKPEEMDAILEEVTRIPNLLRTRASLQTNNVHLCREVTQFGHFKPFPARHAFRPGEMCYLYLELANFSCVPDAAANGFGINLAGSIELRDGAGVLVWRADPKEVPDRVSSIPHDYYRAYRFEVPSVPSGQYSLQVRMVDKPTGRETKKSLTFAVTGK